MRIISVAPTRVQADSRTLKIAISLARFGYESVIVEGGLSHLPHLKSVQLISMDSLPRPSQGRHEDSRSGVKESLLEALPQRRSLLESTRRILAQVLPSVVKRLAWCLFRAGYAIWKQLSISLILPLRFVPRGSLYYLHAPYQFPGVFLRALIHRAPIIYDAHDFYSGIDEGRGNWTPIRRAVGRFHDAVEAVCVRRAAAVVTVSQSVAELIQKTYEREAAVVRNCHDHRLDRHVSAGIRETLNLGDRDFLVVAVGQAKPGAAVGEAVEALRELPENVHLAFLGRGFESRLTSCAAAEGDRLHIVQPVGPDEVVPFIRSASAAVVLYYPRSPNYAGCLPNGFFQSVAAGLPILYPELKEILALAEEYGLGIPIDPRSPASIVSGVAALLEDRSRYRELCENVRRASDALSWEHEEHRLARIVREVQRTREERRTRM